MTGSTSRVTGSTERARSFGAVAAAYAEHRPGYPAAAVGWALEHVAGPDLLDLGAGTGKLTSALLARPGAAVTAVEPDLAMLGELRARYPAADARAGSAESIPLPDGCVDAVLVGQAWHWFDPDRALAEVARVLRPGGVLAALWNHDPENVDWVNGYNEAAARNRPVPGVPAWRGVPAFPAHPAVGRGEVATFPNPVPTSVDGLVSTLATHSWALLSEPAERHAAFARVRAYLATRPEASGGEFVLPLVTEVLRVLRR